MIRYKIYQNQQKKGLNAGKWFARAVSDETFDLAKLAEHMSKHNSPYSSGVIKGVLTDMVDCIKELSKAAETLEEFSLEKNITGMRLKARATGNLSTTNLKLDSQLKQQAEYQKPTTPGGGGSGSGNTPDPKPNPDEGDEEAPDPTV
ncbi:DNA-binding protein [Bacteroides thetaiotaomicron]|uniref:HU family DNA-binding protein n=1 Tax=Bacteroides thetaiotaomicron TaxID=818 RepID=UPI001C00CCC8|nr:DNA-binding protein [Bacteroides thetaiotaomicron]MBT9898880.1 DNA-binding protein [Bacteroides thetaiotaomicron]